MDVHRPCPAMREHPRGAMDTNVSQNESPNEIFNSRQVPSSKFLSQVILHSETMVFALEALPLYRNVAETIDNEKNMAN